MNAKAIRFLLTALPIAAWFGGCQAAGPPSPQAPHVTVDLTPVDPADPDAALKVLAKTTAVYAACDSYRDTGVVRTVTTSGGATWEQSRPFATAFARADRFRFDYRDRRPAQRLWERHVIWSEGGWVRHWQVGAGHPLAYPSLGISLLECQLETGGASVFVPALLIPRLLSTPPVTELADAKLVGIEQQDGVDCYRIEGRWNSGPRRTLWIERDRFLLRRVSGSFQRGRETAEGDVVYSPELNAPVPPRVFEINPDPDAPPGASPDDVAAGD